MDTLAHGLWAAVIYKILNIRLKKKFKIWEAVMFGIFPDLFAFAIPFFVMITGFITGNFTISMFHPAVDSESANFLFDLTHLLYNASHSIMIFLLVFFITLLIFKKPIWVLGGWLLHILVDIPSHGGTEWSTPYLWPFPTPFVDGFPWWQNKWVIIINYSLILIAGIYILIKGKKNGRV